MSRRAWPRRRPRRWTSLAAALAAASESDQPDPLLWSRVRAEAAAVLEAEERLWPALAG